jgi:hypothetical protein
MTSNPELSPAEARRFSAWLKWRAAGDEPGTDLVNRLRGIYQGPVDDGAGPLNGSNTFTRIFEGLPPIHGEAADAIESYEEKLSEVRRWHTEKSEESLEFQRECLSLREQLSQAEQVINAARQLRDMSNREGSCDVHDIPNDLIKGTLIARSIVGYVDAYDKDYPATEGGAS